MIIDFILRKSNNGYTALGNIPVPYSVFACPPFMPVISITFNGKIGGWNKNINAKRANGIFGNELNSALSKSSLNLSLKARRPVLQKALERTKGVFGPNVRIPSREFLSTIRTGEIRSPHAGGIHALLGTITIPVFVAWFYRILLSALRAGLFRPINSIFLIHLFYSVGGFARVRAEPRRFDNGTNPNKIGLSAINTNLFNLCAFPGNSSHSTIVAYDSTEVNR